MRTRALSYFCTHAYPLLDKTQVFHDQIEVKQKELQPWTARINTKQAEIDVASSERDALVRKADAMKEALTEAQDNLENLRTDLNAKVRVLSVMNPFSHVYHSTRRRLGNSSSCNPTKTGLQRN
jgi:chlorite dismutase